MMRTIRSKTAARRQKEAYAEEHPPSRQIAFLLQDWTDAYNVGAMFRVADALGAEELVLTGDTPEPEGRVEGRRSKDESGGSPAASERTAARSPGTSVRNPKSAIRNPPDPRLAVTSLGAHRRVPWYKIKGHEEAALALKAEGWTLVAVEIAEGAVPYTEFDFPNKTCLVLGSEQRGVYDKVLKHCAAAVFIPMAGKGRSLNVTHAGAVVGFWVRQAPTASQT
jgi:tRNA G18 (ribose-2'-O)-methylase SpoU